VSVPTTGEAALLYAGRRVEIPPDGLVLGRSPEDGMPVDSVRASRAHARVEPHDGGFRVVDLDSKNGTFLNGRRLDGPAELTSGDAIGIGDQTVHFVAGQATRAVSRELPPARAQLVPLDRPRLTIGRDPSCDLVLDDPNVSRLHAELRREGGVVELADLGSTNGTWVNGERVRSERLGPGAEVRVGSYRLVFDGESVVARDERALVVRADGVMRQAGGKRILAPTSLTLEPGRFVAIIGGSGAGKTTLLKLLAGVTRPSAGSVTVNGDDVALHRTGIGYVPQHEVVHGKLTVLEELGYAARLRLPEDTTPAEVAQVCERVLEELGLEEHAHTRIEHLSGGQRRRVGVALELLNRPGLLYLDEPTTGLDPGLEARMMALLRDLAAPGRTVVLVTHATASLALCDELVVMGTGGHLRFHGPPDAAREFFGVGDLDGIYRALDDEAARPAPPPEPAGRRGDGARRPATGSSPATEPPRRRFRPQVRVLAARYLRAFSRDRRNLLILLGQVPLIALALVGLFGADALRATGSPNDTAQLLFLLVTVAIWVGAIDAAREIVKERGVLARETAVGVRVSAFLASKVIVLGGLVALQVFLLAGIVLAARPLEGGPGHVAGLIAVLLFTGLASVAMGLVVSGAARSQDQATSFVPLVLVPQLFFAGAIIPIDKMTAPIEAVSRVVYARWAYAASGVPADLGDRFAARPGSLYGDFFEASLPLGLAILGLFIAALLALALFLARRQAREE
jgi:ABC-type multidrug transport system ATPase subunit/ABC-type multidrug transport system permease subunit